MKKKWITNFLKFLLFLSIGAGILYLVFRSQDIAYQEDCALKGISPENCSLLHKIFQDFSNANYFWIVLVLVAYMLSNVSRALRWQMLVRPLGYKTRFSNAFFSTIIGYFANLGIPRMGEVARAAVFARYEKISPEKVMGTIVVDRVLDVICLLSLIGLAFLLEFDVLWGYISEHSVLDEKLANVAGNPVLWFLFVVFAGISILLYFYRKKLIKLPLFKKFQSILLGFWEGIKTVRQLDRPALFIFHTIFIWGMYYLMMYLAFFSFEPTSGLSPVNALLVFVFGSLGIVIPSPGGMGSYHFLVMAALALYGVNGNDAFSFANIIFFSVQLFGNIFFGIISLILLSVINRNYTPVPSEKIS